MEHSDILGNLDEDQISNISYGSHKNRFKDESHKGSVNHFDLDDDHEEKRDVSKEELENLDGKLIFRKGMCLASDKCVIQFLDEDEVDYQTQMDADKINDAATDDIILQASDCFPDGCYKRFPFLAGDEDSPFWQGWGNLRFKTYQLIENKYFETAVITMILLSSLALALEDVYLPQRPILQDILYYMDRIFTVIFAFEMLIKWLALGFQKYFTNAWCWLDFVIVMVSLINFIASLCGAGGIQAFKTMRTLRALRPLRAMSRMQGMRV